MDITAILTAVGFFKKIVPVVEAVGAEIGPVVQAEMADGAQIWADIQKAVADLKVAYERIEAAVKPPPAA